jgi:hypothetical protein
MTSGRPLSSMANTLSALNIGQPQPPVVPARSLAEPQPIKKRRKLQRFHAAFLAHIVFPMWRWPVARAEAERRTAQISRVFQSVSMADLASCRVMWASLRRGAFGPAHALDHSRSVHSTHGAVGVALGTPLSLLSPRLEITTTAMIFKVRTTLRGCRRS